MDTPLETFLTRLAAGAGSSYVWHLEEGCLAARVTADCWLCTLTAQATLEYGIVLYDWQYAEACKVQSMDFETGYLIMHASDGHFPPGHAVMAPLRARLLRICGVQEEVLA